MKRIVLNLLCMMAIAATSDAQTYFCIEYDEVTTERGELYQYSKRYLNANNAVTEDATTYVLTDIFPCEAPQEVVKQPKEEKTKTQTTKVVGLSEEALMAGSTQRMAECVAKQIYRIREARLAIVSGDVEHVPSDGKAMKLALKELDEQEKDLTKLFMGRTIIKHHVEYIRIDTLKDGRQVIARFSRYTGPVAQDDLSGEPIIYEQETTYQQVLAAIQPTKKKAEPVYEQKAVNRKISIIYNRKTIYETYSLH